MSSLPSYEFLDPIFEKEDLIEGFKAFCGRLTSREIHRTFSL